MVERGADNAEVQGSTPCMTTKKRKKKKQKDKKKKRKKEKTRQLARVVNGAAC